MNWFGRIARFFQKICNDLGVWLLSILFSVVLPVAPATIDIVKHLLAPEYFEQVQLSTLLITAVIMTATYIATTQHPLIKGFYLINLMISFVFYSIPVDEIKRSELHNVKLGVAMLIFGIALVHSAERFWWHVYMNDTFPEKRSNSKKEGERP